MSKYMESVMGMMGSRQPAKDIEQVKVSMTLFDEDSGKCRYLRGTMAQVVKRWWTDTDLPNNDSRVVTLKIGGKDRLGEFTPYGKDFYSVMACLTVYARGIAYAGGHDELMHWDDGLGRDKFYWED